MAVPDPGRQFVQLGSDYSTVAVEGVGVGTVPGLAFTPAPNTRYYVEGVMIARVDDTITAASFVAPRVGLEWPSVGILDSVCLLTGSSLYIGPTTNHAEGELLTVNRTVTWGGVSSPGYSYPVLFRASFVTDVAVTGDFQVLLFSETGTKTVRLKAGSFLAIYSNFLNQ